MAEALKNMYNHSFFDRFISIVKSPYPSFDEGKFLEIIFDEEWKEKELKQRTRHITIAVRETFPESYQSAIGLLLEIAPQCTGIEYLFFPDFVEMYGLEDWDISMDALEQFTKYSSSEFAVRPFIMKDQDKMMAQMKRWSVHEDHHVRRLASEGCRPRLPWGKVLRRLKEDPTSILPILDQLKEDESLYVRKSVANNINDISKDHPELVRQLVRDWRGHHDHTDWILKHGSRSLLKKGDVEALRLFGFKPPANINIDHLTLSHQKLNLGDKLSFSFELQNTSGSPEKLRIEYGVDFVKANGRQSRKVFHLSSATYDNGNFQLNREQLFKDLTTRKHYTGIHGLCILVNGEEKASAEFELVV